MSGYRLFKYAESLHEYTLKSGTNTHRTSIEPLRMPDGAGPDQRKLGWVIATAYRSTQPRITKRHVEWNIRSRFTFDDVYGTATPWPIPLPTKCRDDSTSYHHPRSERDVILDRVERDGYAIQCRCLGQLYSLQSPDGQDDRKPSWNGIRRASLGFQV
jgi:hypothetical protein